MKQSDYPTLPYVKFVKAKGRTYPYFNLGEGPGGKLSWARLPDFGSSDFANAYERCLRARPDKRGRPYNSQLLDADLRHFQQQIGSRGQWTGEVYFIRCHTGEIKIGRARCARRRLNTLQVAHVHKLELLAVRKGGKDIESTYHKQFAEHHITGEWFKPAEDILAEITRLRLSGTKRAQGNGSENIG